MRICWDNLENLRYSKKTSKWYKGTITYFYIDECKACKSSFLSQSVVSKYCCHSCSQSGANNSFYNKLHTEENKGLWSESKKGINNPNYGKHHTEETKRKIGKNRKGKGRLKGINNPNYGKYHTEETKRRMRESHKDEKSSNWKGGVKKRNVPLYNTYASQLEWCEEVRRSPTDRNILEVRCTYCGRWHIPKRWNVSRRIQFLKGNINGENHLYCSTNCKKACPIYGKTPQTLMREDAIRAGRLGWLELNREVQPELRKMVLKRDGYQCIKCKSSGPLHCHHIFPVAIEPIESADMDNCITYCIECHKKVHKEVDGCGYGELKIDIC